MIIAEECKSTYIKRRMKTFTTDHHGTKEKGLIIRADDQFKFNALRNPVENFDDENQKELGGDWRKQA